jgi:hypothetical protein
MEHIKKIIDEQILLLQNPTEENIVLVNNNLELLSTQISKEIKVLNETDLRLKQIEAKSKHQ